MAGRSEGLQGCLSAATRGRVTGWARDAGVEDRLEVGVLVDGEHVARDRALIFDESLRGAGVGDGAHAFAIEMPERLRDGVSHSIGVAALASGAMLVAEADFLGKSPPGDPWYATEFVPAPVEPLAAVSGTVADAGAAESQGSFEAIIDGSAFGWAYDRRSPRRTVALEVLVDGEIVAETVADLLRPSLVNDGIGDGRHGFLVALPPALCDGGAHTISIRPLDGEPLLCARAFTTTASKASEWADTTFLVGDSICPPAPPSSGLAPASPLLSSGRRQPSPASGNSRVHAATTAVAARTLRLRPRDELDFSRGPSGGEFTSRAPETIVLAPEMDVDLPDPRHFAVQPGVTDPLAERRMRFDSPRRYSVPRLLASRLQNAIVDTTSFLVMPTEHEYLRDTVRHPAALRRCGYEQLEDAVLRYELEGIPERDERVVVLGAQSNSNYSHWLLESVVRALLFEPLDDGTWLYLTPPLREWQRQTLALIGVGPERILEVEPEGPVRFREVAAVSRGMGGLPAIRPAGVAALAALAAPSSERRRLYCSRASTRHRHASNEAEMVELLTRHGFESVSPETLTIAEQIETFAGADVVFALHGSALTNIAFSRPGTLVIELQAEGFNHGGVVWNWILASLRDQPFVQVVCPLADVPPDLPHASRDVTVDLRHLDALLERVLPG